MPSTWMSKPRWKTAPSISERPAATRRLRTPFRERPSCQGAALSKASQQDGSPATGRYIVLRDASADFVQDDPDADYRIAMAIVYKDAAAASAAHLEAHRRAEVVTGSSYPFSNDNGPQLLDGYGGSVWRENVALVETRKRTLNSMYTTVDQTGATALARPDLTRLGFATSFAEYAVDRDFIDCLDNGFAAAVNQAAIQSVEPIFLPGRPW